MTKSLMKPQSGAYREHIHRELPKKCATSVPRLGAAVVIQRLDVR